MTSPLKITAVLAFLALALLFTHCGGNSAQSSNGTTGSSSGSGSGSGTSLGPTSGPGQLSAPKFLYSSDNAGNRVLGYLVNASTGAISPTTQGSAPTHTDPTRVASDAGGNRLYVINRTSEDLSAYSISRSDGALTSAPGSPFAIGRVPRSLAVSPSGAYVYVAAQNSTTDHTSFIYPFAVQSDGSLTPVAGSPYSTVDGANVITTDPQGKFLYVGSWPSSTTTIIAGQIDAYSIASNGALTPVPGSPFALPSSPCAAVALDMAVHPSGNFLILATGGCGLVIYGIDRTSGTLSLVNGSPFPPGISHNGVNSVAVDPQGAYLWVVDEYCFSGCSVGTENWKFDSTSGVPTYLSSGTAGCGELARSDPSGKFVYEIGSTSSNTACGGSTAVPGIWGFGVNRGSGSLNNISGSPWQSPNSDFLFNDGLVITP